jgi:predicted MFS family arabinose efflux permease/pSer/pThr/pTyr-binding forkhead associated (FHA) protein
MSDNLYIEIISYQQPVQYYTIGHDSVIVGRSADRCDLTLNDPHVSRIHLQINRAPDGELMLTDLDTSNGSSLAGTALAAQISKPWRVGQQVTLGDTHLILRRGELPQHGLAQPIDDSSANLEATRLYVPSTAAHKTSAVARLANTVGMVLLLGLSLLLLVYVGVGEAKRTYPTFELDKLAAQVDTVKNSIETTLLAGLPLEQLPGFIPLTKPLLDSDSSLVSMYVTNPSGQIVFSNARTNANPLAVGGDKDYRVSSLQKKDNHYGVTENSLYYRVSVDLQSKFETVGKLHITMLKSVISEKIASGFIFVALAAGIILIVFAITIEVDLFLSSRRKSTQATSWLNISYTVAFFVMAAVVIVTLVNIYSSGIRAKTQALANSLGQRLSTPLQLGMNISDFAGLDTVFHEYQQDNPDLSFVALTTNNTITIHTDPTMAGKTWDSPANHFEYDFPLQSAGGVATQAVLRVGVPTSAVYSKLWASVKNFFVLFVAAGFLSLLFFSLMWAFIHKPTVDSRSSKEALILVSNFQLSLIRPLYFLTVFADALNSSFLPQYYKALAAVANVDTGIVSTLFTVYFLSFLITLVPAGQFAERRGVKPLLTVGSLLIAMALILTPLVPNLYAMFAFRILDGVGGGMLLIGVQSYILDIAVSGQKTQGAAIVVFGYNGGTISGTAIGALLAVYMGQQGVFVVGAITAALAFFYVSTLIPRGIRRERPAGAAHRGSLLRNVRSAARDFEFMKAMLFVGIPAKAVLTGVTIFALPLLLARQNYAQEDIGQIIMLYGAGVLISSSYVSRLVDRLGRTTSILFIGTLGSGIGLVLIGLAGVDLITRDWKTVLLIVGVSTLGLAHGFIHAPIVTHISETSAADTLGKSSATSLYRLLERFGHVAGPIIVGELLFLNSDHLTGVSWLGVIVIFLGILFLIHVGVRSPREATLSPSA